MKEFLGLEIGGGDFVRSLNRLGELKAVALPMQAETIGAPLSKTALRALWPRDERLSSDLPAVIVGTQQTLADLLPRLLALPGAAMPITSLMKAWQVEDISKSISHGESPLSHTATLGFVGLIIGELSATIGSETDLRLIGIDGVRRTLSFVCAQAVMRGWRSEALATIVERWFDASTLTSNEIRGSSIVPIAGLCGFLQALSDLSDTERPSVQSLAANVQDWIDARLGAAQTDLLQQSLSQYVAALGGIKSREKRYDLIMEAVSQPDERRHPLEQGFLISLIEPGSLDFLELAKRLDPNAGAVAAAYCACATILGGEATLSKFGGFGWNVVRHGLKTNVEFSADISIDELRILYNMKRDSPIAFRTRSPVLVDVEIAPMVTGSFANQARRKTAVQRTEDDEEASAREEALRERLGTALRAVEDAYALAHGKRLRNERKVTTYRR